MTRNTVKLNAEQIMRFLACFASQTEVKVATLHLKLEFSRKNTKMCEQQINNRTKFTGRPQAIYIDEALSDWRRCFRNNFCGSNLNFLQIFRDFLSRKQKRSIIFSKKNYYCDTTLIRISCLSSYFDKIRRGIFVFYRCRCFLSRFAQRRRMHDGWLRRRSIEGDCF